MDYHLQQLRRNAQTEGTPEAWQQYASALERALPSSDSEPEPIKAWIIHHWHDARIETSKVVFSAHKPTVEQVLAADEDDDLAGSVFRWRRAKHLHPDNPYEAFHIMDKEGNLREGDITSYWGYEHGLSLEGPFDVTEALPPSDDLPFTDYDKERQAALGQPVEEGPDTDCEFPFMPWALCF